MPQISSLIRKKLDPTFHDMNNLNEDDEDLSARVHTFVQHLVDNGAKNEFMADTFHCPGDDGELVKIYGFVGTAIIKSHI